MRSSILFTTIAAALAFGSAACSSAGTSGGVQASSSVAPDANLTELRTFRVLDAPLRRSGAPALAADDPMLTNSMTNRVLRNDLVLALEQKGYDIKDSNPDFLVAYYAGTKEKMDTTYWNPDPMWRYGFRGRRAAWAWPWYGSGGPEMQLETYTQGSVIVDVVNPQTQELIWRGQGVAPVSNDPNTYATELGHSVDAVMQKFPNAQGAVVGR